MATNNTRQADLRSTLRQLGADAFDLMLPETHSLATLLHDNEQVQGIVYGRYRQSGDKPSGRGALVATDQRIIFLDHKPLFESASEISYEVVSGVSKGTTGWISTVTLNTRMGEITIRTFNQQCAEMFMHAIETHVFDRPADFRPL